jgi:hypothetical protein
VSSAASELVSRSGLSGVAAGVHLRALSASGSTAGQILDAASPISTGTAAAHLLSINAGAVTGTISATAPAATLVASGTHTAPGVSGTIDAIAPIATAAISGDHGVAGAIVATAPGAALIADGVHVPPAITGTISATAPAATLSATGAHGVAGSIASAAPGATAAIVAAHGVAGAITAEAPGATFVGSGIAAAVFGQLAAVAPDATIQASGLAFQVGFAEPRAPGAAAADRGPQQGAIARLAPSVASPRAISAAVGRTSFFVADDRVLPPLPVGILASVSPNATGFMQGSA